MARRIARGRSSSLMEPASRVSRPAVTQHLKVLRCAGLVTDRQVGTRRLYQVDPRGVEALRAELDVFWDKALAAFKQIADEEGKQP